MKITKRKKALLGFAASTIMVLGACGDESVPLYGLPDSRLEAPVMEPVYGVSNYDVSYTERENYKEEFYIKEIPDDIYHELVYTFNPIHVAIQFVLTCQNNPSIIDVCFWFLLEEIIDWLPDENINRTGNDLLRMIIKEEI